MTDWVTITGAGTTTATKFFGDITNKFSNMFNGVDVSDTVVINAAVTWTMGNMTMTGRFQTDKGADVASGGIITLGTDGNVFDITGTTNINEILGTTWTLGAQIVLQFDGVLTVNNNSGGTNDIILAGGTNFTTAAGNTLSLYFDGTDWIEVSRNTVAGDALTSGTLAQFASTTSAELATLLSNETGSGLVVFNSAATITQPLIDYSINAQTGTSYTPVLSDAGAVITSSNASAVTVTIPPNSSVAYPIGSSITVISIGVGLTSFAQGAGVTITSTGATPAAPVLRIQHASATAIKTATDTWRVVGDIA